jgi:hypothetical protein
VVGRAPPHPYLLFSMHQGTRILRDLTLVTVGAFLLLHEELTKLSPSPVLIGAGLASLGGPQILRLAGVGADPEPPSVEPPSPAPPPARRARAKRDA